MGWAGDQTNKQSNHRHHIFVVSLSPEEASGLTPLDGITSIAELEPSELNYKNDNLHARLNRMSRLNEIRCRCMSLHEQAVRTSGARLPPGFQS